MRRIITISKASILIDDSERRSGLAGINGLAGIECLDKIGGRFRSNISEQDAFNIASLLGEIFKFKVMRGEE